MEASMRTLGLWTSVWIATLVCGAFATAQAGGLELDRFRGHLGIGYAKLFIGEAPGGSMSIAGGVEYPVATTIDVGIDIGYHLMGSRTEIRDDILLADVDYSLFEVSVLAYWTPPWPGPVGRLSFGPGLYSARAELSTSGGGAGFSDLAVDEAIPGLSFGAELVTRKASPLRVGLELGGRVAFVADETWSGAVARAVFHY
jgi:hypothetical protein